MAPLRPTAASSAAGRSLLAGARRPHQPQQQQMRALTALVCRFHLTEASRRWPAPPAPATSAVAVASAGNHSSPFLRRRGLASSPAAATTREEEEQQQRPAAGSGSARAEAASSTAAAGTEAPSAPSSRAGATAGGSDNTAAGGRPTRRLRPAPIQLTERAVARIKELLAEKAEAGGSTPLGVRLGVRRRGCNGLSYTLNYATERPKHDEVVESRGVTVFVDPMALMNVVGTVMDFEETELSREFTFQNPNVKGKCGCGESFNV